MELLQQVTNIQFLYAAAAVTVVLICAALVFAFGFHSAEQPQFDKLPLVVDDKKSSAKKKKKDKKTSPNRNVTEDNKAKSESKKSPSKEKREDKVKEPEKKKEKVLESKTKTATVSDVKKGKKGKIIDVAKPDDFDDGEWKEVPKKSEKKKAKSGDEKESPVKKNKKKTKDSDIEAARPSEERNAVVGKNTEESPVKVVMSGPGFDEEATRALQAQVEELQRALKAAELRDQGILVEEEESMATSELSEVKDLRSNKKQENKEKQNKKKANDAAIAAKNAAKAEVEKDSDSSEKQDEKKNVPAFDELGDTWTEAKAPKKSKKKARKE